MKLRDDDCYRALAARDTRFDGQFFTCVSSTGIYCRPICPARTPRRAHCTFVASAAAAQDAGYRPCLRCRPESAPGSPEWLGNGSLLRRALRIMTERAADTDFSLETVSDELTISSRQLRRLFAESLGTSPISIVQTSRLAIARQLLVGTALPITEVALASGFGSVRRFNSAVRKTFGTTPTLLRRKHGKSAVAGNLRVHLDYRPPYAWDQLIAHFRARSIAGLETAGERYIRTIRAGQAKGLVCIGHDAKRHRMQVDFMLDRTDDLSGAVANVRDLLDLDAVPDAIGDHLAADPLLKRIVAAHRGLRFPGSWSVFEMLVRAIVGQQVSVAAARTVLGRLVEAFGVTIEPPDDEPGLPNRLFPEPVALADVSLQGFGLNTARAQTINRVAELFAADPRYVHAGMPAEAARSRLLAIRGIGPWTADYVLLRALRYPDAFPAADLGGVRAAGARSAAELLRMAERWRPWRGYALLYLWKTLESSKS